MLFPHVQEELAEFAQKAQFPLLLKGIDGWRLWGRTRKKMFIVANLDQLIKTYDAAEDPANPNLMIQEYIPGGDDTVWMYNGYFDSRSDELVGFTGKKIRQCPVHTGCTSLGTCVSNDVVAQTARRFMKALGYRGILDIDYRYDARDGLYKVLDVNPRIGGTFRLFVGANGIDVARALYLDLTGQPVVRSAAAEGRRWIVEDLDLVSSYRYFREGGLTKILGWLKSLHGVDERAYLSFAIRCRSWSCAGTDGASCWRAYGARLSSLVSKHRFWPWQEWARRSCPQREHPDLWPYANL